MTSIVHSQRFCATQPQARCARSVLDIVLVTLCRIQPTIATARELLRKISCCAAVPPNTAAIQHIVNHVSVATPDRLELRSASWAHHESFANTVGRCCPQVVWKISDRNELSFATCNKRFQQALRAKCSKPESKTLAHGLVQPVRVVQVRELHLL